jgi:hypothetical protein
VLSHLPLHEDERRRLTALTLEQLDAAIPRGEMPAKRTACAPSDSVHNSKRIDKHARRLEAQLRAAKRPLFI